MYLPAVCVKEPSSDVSFHLLGIVQLSPGNSSKLSLKYVVAVAVAARLAKRKVFIILVGE
jgi:hypothetical protein